MKTKLPKLSKLIKECKFDYVNPTITDDLFKVPKEISKEFRLRHFDEYISSEDAIKEMAKEGYRPANVYELLEYSKRGWNGSDLVVALGSVAEVDGGRHVPYLDKDDSLRYLYLGWFDPDWSAFYHFLETPLSSESPKLSTSESLTLGNLDFKSFEMTIENRVKKLEDTLSKIKELL